LVRFFYSDVVSKVCHVDIETFSECPLKQAGVYKYCEDPSTEILVICFAFDFEPVNVWIPDLFLPQALKLKLIRWLAEHQPGAVFYTGCECPHDILRHAEAGGEFRAHNASFERNLFRSHAGQTIGWPELKRSQWVCTMAKASVHNLPGGLEALASALDVKNKKIAEGKGAMMQLSKPRTPSKHNPATRWLPDEVPDKFFTLYVYCVGDVDAERDCDHAVEDLTKTEQKIYLLDQKINDRGIYIDKRGIEDAQYLIVEYKARLEKACRSITGFNPSQTQKLAIWIEQQGITIENLQAQTVRDALKRKDLPEDTRHVLRIRSLHAMKAPAKYTAMQRAVCEDGMLRGMFRHYGASTGRWSSWIVQLQNLFRSVIDDADFAIEVFRERSVKAIKFWWSENPMKIFSSCVRGMLISRPGHDLIAADFSSIEARIVAWLAGSEILLEIFATHGLVYEYTAAKIFGHPTDLEYLKTFKKNHPKLRFLGKIAVLALGFGGGGNAFVKMAKQFGTEVDFENGENIKWDWREANPEIADTEYGLWAQVESAAVNAIEEPEITFEANRLAFRVVGDFLYMRVPSGRKLAYYKPEMRNNELTYMGIDTYKRIWMRCKTYGGKLVQNAAEAIARDLMVAAMFKLDETGRYPMLGTVHDEIITEPKEGVGSVDEVVAIMCDKPEWAAGLPVGASGFRSKRYRK
jgi:DNA polymerase